MLCHPSMKPMNRRLPGRKRINYAKGAGITLAIARKCNEGARQI
jgi:hypothetical protein